MRTLFSRKVKVETFLSRSRKANIEWSIPEDTEIGRQMKLIALAPEDLALIRTIKPLVEESIEDVITDFYQIITDDPKLYQIIVENSHIDRLKKTFKDHLLEIFDGDINQLYIEKRVRIAQIHVKVGLNTKWYISAFQTLSNSLMHLIENKVPDRLDAIRVMKAISKLLNFEQQLVLEAYEKETERLRLIQEEKNKRVLQLSETAENLAAISEETNASLMDLTSHAEKIEEGTAKGTELSTKTEQLAKEGKELLKNSLEQMKTITNSMDQIVSKSTELERIANQINEIVTIIESISDRTSLLALNAAIESARAGEYGKGFEVVAKEIRKLADQSKKSIWDVSELISETNTQITQVTASVYDIKDLLTSGHQLMNDTNNTFDEIENWMLENKTQNLKTDLEIRSFVKMLSEISHASSQLARIAEHLNTTTQELNTK